MVRGVKCFKRFRVQWTSVAQADLNEIIDYIAAEDVRAAGRVFSSLRRAAAALERLPDRGRQVPELKLIDVYTHRELIARPWRIIYRRERTTVFVVAVLDGGRDLENLLIERWVRP